MLHKMHCVYDSAAHAFLPPFFTQTTDQAIRAFRDLANDKNHNFGRYPSDYTLFFVGDWEDADASFVCPATPVSLGKALEFVRDSAPPKTEG